MASELFRTVFYADATEKSFESILGQKQLYVLIIRSNSALPDVATCALLATIREHDSDDLRAIYTIDSQALRWDVEASLVNLWLCCTHPTFQGQGLMFGQSVSTLSEYSLSVFDEFVMKLRASGIKYYRVATIERKYPIMYKKLESMNRILRFQVRDDGETKTVYFMKV